MSSSVTPFRELGLAIASKKKLVVAMASSVVGLWSGRLSPARPFVGPGGAAVLDPTAFSFRPFLLIILFVKVKKIDLSGTRTSDDQLEWGCSSLYRLPLAWSQQGKLGA